VVPVAIFLRTAERAPASLVLGTERRPYLRFEYLACRLAETPAERWLDSDNVVARVNLPNMRRAGVDLDRVVPRAVGGLLEREADGARRAKYLEFIDIYAGLTDNELRRYRRRHPEEGSIVTGFFQRARDEGRAEGIERGLEQGIERGLEQGIERGLEQGIERGRAEGERAVLARQLRRRFGRLPPEAAERLRRAPETELRTWADNVLDAETLDDVFRSSR